MEQLQALLRTYNLNHTNNVDLAPWSKQFCKDQFPNYWKRVYTILSKLSRDNRIIEIGSGLGDITSIPCYLGFKKISSFERDEDISNAAKNKLKELFNRSDVILASEYPNDSKYESDILLLVNCVYGDSIQNKEEYLSLLKSYYISAGAPKYYILEVIDDSYTEFNREFPEHIRLGSKDIFQLFPNFNIKSWPTYIYPTNDKSKTLYLIEKI